MIKLVLVCGVLVDDRGLGWGRDERGVTIRLRVETAFLCALLLAAFLRFLQYAKLCGNLDDLFEQSIIVDVGCCPGLRV